MSKPAPHPLFKLATELGPLLIFFLANARFGLFVATAVFMAAVVVAIATSYAVTRHVPVMALVTAVVVMVFGALTLYLHDETFIKMKPTVVYAMFAVVLAYGLIAGKPLLRMLLESAYPGLTARGWHKLTLNWIGFFIAMAALNEAVWRNFSWDFWVGFKLWGAVPLTLLFAIANIPMLLRNGLSDPTVKDAPLPPEG